MISLAGQCPANLVIDHRLRWEQHHRRRIDRTETHQQQSSPCYYFLRSARPVQVSHSRPNVLVYRGKVAMVKLAGQRPGRTRSTWPRVALEQHHGERIDRKRGSSLADNCCRARVPAHYSHSFPNVLVLVYCLMRRCAALWPFVRPLKYALLNSVRIVAELHVYPGLRYPASIAPLTYNINYFFYIIFYNSTPRSYLKLISGTIYIKGKTLRGIKPVSFLPFLCFASYRLFACLYGHSRPILSFSFPSSVARGCEPFLLSK